MKETILVTGGTGYIGSHTCVSLIKAGYRVIILDNLSNSQAAVVESLYQITQVKPIFIEGDVRDQRLLEQLFSDYAIAAVIHFASLKSVNESIHQPLTYYDNNLRGIITLLFAMEKAAVKTLIFSSSAAIYGDSDTMPVREDFPKNPTNPYSRSKLFIEHILTDHQQAHPEWNIACLRYFNPVGAHPSGLIGENPNQAPSNLMPCILRVATGQSPELKIYGNDYPTKDGTGVRDYIHVMDLAEGHVSALHFLEQNPREPLIVNLGTGQGFSVFEILHAFEQVSGQIIPYKILPRRSGDIAQSWADPSLAFKSLGWRAQKNLLDMCEDSWRWQKNNQGAKHGLENLASDRSL